jgi:hypothetical protein
MDEVAKKYWIMIGLTCLAHEPRTMRILMLPSSFAGGAAKGPLGNATFLTIEAAVRSRADLGSGHRSSRQQPYVRMSAVRVRREKAELSSGCKAHPAKSLQLEATVCPQWGMRSGSRRQG